MEKGSADVEWRFGTNMKVNTNEGITIRGVLKEITNCLDPADQRPVILLGNGDPAAAPSFRTSPIAEDAIADALRSARFNTYSPTIGMLPARRAVAEYLSRDLPYKLSSDDVFLTVGCTQAIEVALTVLSRPGANILLPKPGFPHYEARASFDGLEYRHYHLLPERSWEFDLDAIESLADHNTVAIVIVNPGNPCGNVFSHQYLKKVAETARRLGLLVIADEVYGHLAYGSNPFVPMGVFSSIVPVITLGSISKRWVVPGWRLGWLVINDPNGYLKKSKVVEYIAGYVNIVTEPATFIQGALPQILGNTKDDFFNKVVGFLSESADICYENVMEINSLTCPRKPEGCMFLMAKIELSLLEDIEDDMDFCLKLAKEESVVILPASATGLKNWVRVAFTVDASSLREGWGRIKSFCKRHEAKNLKDT